MDHAAGLRHRGGPGRGPAAAAPGSPSVLDRAARPGAARATSADLTRATLRCRWLVNAAGLHSDRIDRMLGGDSGSRSRPRRGELIVFDKLARPLLAPSCCRCRPRGPRACCVAPTVYGNVLLGPTAEDMRGPGRHRHHRGRAGRGPAGRGPPDRCPSWLAEEVTATYAGLRAATEHRDYQIRVDAKPAGTPARRGHPVHRPVRLARHRRVPGRPARRGRAAAAPSGTTAGPPVMPYIGQAGSRPYQDAARIAADPEYGRIVCHCERVTRGEIRDALASTVPPADLDGLRRRTRAVNGRCQGFYCAATVSGLLAELPVARRPGRPAASLPAQPAPPGPARPAARAVNADVDVLIVGAGPAGLAAAVELRRLGAGPGPGGRPGGGGRAACHGTARTPGSACATCTAC